MNHEQQIKKILEKHMITYDGEVSVYFVNINLIYDYLAEIIKDILEVEYKEGKKPFIGKNKNKYLLRKWITRFVLSNVIGMPAKEIQYIKNDYGKPYITGEQKINFNISHSKDYLMIGVSKNKEIGVDIQNINPNVNHELMSDCVFSKEELEIYCKMNRDDKKRLFYQVWCKKESVSKALGLGLILGLNNYTVMQDKISFGKQLVTIIESGINEEYAYAISLIN